MFNMLGEERIEFLHDLMFHRKDIIHCLDKEEAQEVTTEKKPKPWKQNCKYLK
jgi:hypothetical protein